MTECQLIVHAAPFLLGNCKKNEIGVTMFAMIVGAALALALIGLPFGIIWLFIETILNRKNIAIGRRGAKSRIRRWDRFSISLIRLTDLGGKPLRKKAERHGVYCNARFDAARRSRWRRRESITCCRCL